MSSNKRDIDALVKRLDDPEDRDNDIYCAITLSPELRQLLHREVNIRLHTSANDGLNDDWMWLIANFEDIV